MRTVAAASLAGLAAGHGAMNRPPPRASGGANFTDRPGCAGPGKTGQACLWFNVGCQNGCTCIGTGKSMYPTPQQLKCHTPTEPTLPDKYRTWNLGDKSEQGDWGKYMPWRSPGHSTPLNPCGIASGYVSGPYAEAPIGYKVGDKGTDIPPLKSGPTVWKAGGTEKVSFSMLVNHGGGYQYRVCPKSKEPTNECFEEMPLAFATAEHTIHFEDGSRQDITIPANDVSTGTKPAGSAWRRDPIPACNCDLSEGCSASGRGMSKAYADDSAQYKGTLCPSGVQFNPPAPGLLGYSTMVDPPLLAAPRRQPSTLDAGKQCVAGCDDIGAYSWNCKTCSADGAGCDVCCAGCTKATKAGVTYCAAGKGPAPPAPAGGNYLCKAGQCYAGYGTQSQAACEQSCGAGPTPPSGGNYLCKNGQCYAGYGSEDKATCERTCGSGPAPAPKGGSGYSIQDQIKVPEQKGEYILQFRWDCEQTDQIWNTCADVSIQ